jgi:Fe-S-cluster containining protein
MFNDYEDVKKQVGEYDPEVPDRALRRKLQVACKGLNQEQCDRIKTSKVGLYPIPQKIILSFGDKEEEAKLTKELNELLIEKTIVENDFPRTEKQCDMRCLKESPTPRCCVFKNGGPSLTPIEAETLPLDEEGLKNGMYILQTRKDGSCIFLNQENGKCAINDRKPNICAEYVCHKPSKNHEKH